MALPLPNTASTTVPRTVFYLDHTSKWSGGEIALLRTLEAIDRTRIHPVAVLAEEGPFSERLRGIDIEVLIEPLDEGVREVRKDSLGGRGIAAKLGAAGALWRYARRIARLARERNATVLHCNSLKSDVYGLIAGRMAGVPVLWHVRDHIDPTYLPGIAVKLFRAAAKSLPDFVVCNSDSSLQKLFPEGPGRQQCRAIHDGLADRELTSPPPTSTTWKNNPPRVGIVGRITRWKGQHVFLQAARLLAEQGRGEARFLIIGAPLFGEADYERELRDEAISLGERVEFLGFRDDIPELLRALDVMVHASVTPEPFGQVVVEAMAEGVPVIASDGGGVREIITHGRNGLLTPMGDADILARELGDLLADPARAATLARAGYDTVRQNFTAAHTARNLEAVYDVIWSSQKRRRGAPAEPQVAAGRGDA